MPVAFPAFVTRGFYKSIFYGTILSRKRLRKAAQNGIFACRACANNAPAWMFRKNREETEIMKKKIAMILSALLLSGAFAGCGSAVEMKPLKDIKVDKYVTIGEYKGLSVTMEPVSVADAEVEEIMLDMYTGSFPQEKGVKDRAVAVGDTVNIDYEGKRDGVAFQGGTAQGALLTIGSGRFIAGFEDGLVGVMPGETVDLNLTFPENYTNAELAGAAVVFTVTVNYIIPAEMDDSVIAGMGIEGITDKEGLHQYVYDMIYSYEESIYNKNKESAVLNTFIDSCAFEELPDNMLNKYEELARTSIQREAQSAGISPDNYTLNYYGMGFENFVKEYAMEALKQNLAMQAVANRENLNINDEELDNMLFDYAAKAGYDSVEEFVGETSKEDFREYFMYERVLDFLVENAAVSE